MKNLFDAPIAEALGLDVGDAPVSVTGGAGDLPSVFRVADLAVASVSAAAQAAARLTGARDVEVDRRLAQLWFGMTLRPRGWTLPPVWDDVAGDYRTSDGWIKLHTNAPRHRAAALSALGCAASREAVAEAVAEWQADALEAAIVAAGGCAAALRGLSDWAAHPQGRAVAAEPLVDWQVMGQGPRAERSLNGLKVLDLTRILAGPVATRFLGGFGAEVLRIDPPGWDEPVLEPEVTPGKRCAGLDLTRREDREIFERLLREADLLVHGYRPGALDGLGYGAEVRRSINPGLVEVSLCAYGWSGPWAGRRGFDSLVQMSAGIAAEGMRHEGAEVPRPLPVQALDHATGYLMAAAACRAMQRRRKGEVVSARLSLARTASLLTQAGTVPPTGPHLQEHAADCCPDCEVTDWGPAWRLRFPIRLDGEGPRWREAAGRLRRHEAGWDADGTSIGAA